MKIAALLFVALACANVNANAITITCAKGAYKVKAELKGAKAPYVLSKRRAEVARGEMNVMAAEFEGSFLNAFVIALQNEEAVLGVAVPEIKDLKTPGTYEGKADLFIPSSAGDFEGSSEDCTVKVE